MLSGPRAQRFGTATLPFGCARARPSAPSATSPGRYSQSPISLAGQKSAVIQTDHSARDGGMPAQLRWRHYCVLNVPVTFARDRLQRMG